MARKILLADDSVTAQNMGRKILADAGYDVVTVNNGSAALKRIAEIKPDLIVLDVYMPGYSGLEVCQRLKDAAETAHIPVLLTVGKLEPFKADEARRVRADGHIVKPFEASELLTAITRLEDHMVPQSEGARFGGDGSGRKTEGAGEPDTGWKSRLRFPSKKKKEESEPEEAEGANFRDFRKGKGKAGGSAAFPGKIGQEPGQVPEIPRDITPDELDALSALAAKLDGASPAAENLAPLADETADNTTVEAAVAAAEGEGLAAVVEAKQEVESADAVVEAAGAAVEAPVFAGEVPEFAVEGKSEIEIPVEHIDLAVEGAVVVADAAAVETQQTETPAAVATVAVDTALLVQEPAPVDRNDEPIFASGASVVEQAEEDKAGERSVEKPTEAVAQIEKAEAAEASTVPEAVAASGMESKPEELSLEKTAETIAASELETEEPTPSDAELAEALRLLTPATGNGAVAAVASGENLTEAGQLAAGEAAPVGASSLRWVAEPVALSVEEAALSLEAEMFSTFALPATNSSDEIESRRITGVSAIAAAVENRLAAAARAAGGTSLVQYSGSSEQGAQGAAAETSAAAAPAEMMAAASEAARPLVDRMSPEAEQTDSAAGVAEEAPVVEAVATTFADAVSEDEVEGTATQNGEPIGGTKAATAGENQDSSSDFGSPESMGKDGKAKSKKSTSQMRTKAASAVASSDVAEEAGKQAEPAAEETPKAMAAAATAEGSSSPSIPDASTIASIVESVMADLRPRIVEEITRKLAGK